MAIVAQNMGDLRQAEVLYLEAIKRQEHAYGDRHPETVIAKGNYGMLLQREGRLTEAEPLLRDAVATRVSLYGPDNYNVGYARVSLAILLHDKGDLAAAEGEFRQALAIYDNSLPTNHQYRAALLMHFARLLVAAEELAAAVPLLAKARGPDDAVVRRAQAWQRIADPNAVQTASTSGTVG